MQTGFAQPSGPIRRQYAVRRSGDRIFGDAVARSEIARDEIHVACGCSDGNYVGMKIFQQCKVGANIAYGFRSLKYCNVCLICLEHLQGRRLESESLLQGIRRVETRVRGEGREVHSQILALPMDGQSSAESGLETNGIELRLA